MRNAGLRVQIFFLIFFISGFGGCSLRNHLFCKRIIVSRPIVLVFPRNVVAVEPVGSLLYDELWNMLVRRGYRVHSFAQSAWYVEIEILSLTSHDELVSPDVLLYAFCVKGTVRCRIRNEHHTIMVQRDISAQQWVYKPECPIQNREYLAYQYRDMCVSLSYSIEQLLSSALEKGHCDIS